ncbi:MAG: type III pantothenate kinase [Planctomycetaceae bacterium]
MPGWILAIDVGNSRIKVGLFADHGCDPFAQGEPRCLKQVGFPLGDYWNADQLEWPELNSGDSIRGVIAGSNPQGIDKVINGWPLSKWETPRVITHSDTFPLTIRVDAPRQVGIDRLLNAVAVNHVRAANRPAIIVDSGTATTVDLVSADGAFCGGAILPGFELSARALHQYTALLPLISLNDLVDRTPAGMGRNTRTALHSGLYWGQVGAVRELVEHLIAESSPSGDQPSSTAADFQFILTGGGAPLLHKPLGEERWLSRPYLALEGLVIVDRAMGCA